MQPLADNDIRASFINCSKGEARRIALPRNLSELPWEDLDFLGWRDPGAPDRGYVVAERARQDAYAFLRPNVLWSDERFVVLETGSVSPR